MGGAEAGVERPRAGQHQTVRRVRHALITLTVHVVCLRLHDPFCLLQAKTPEQYMEVSVVPGVPRTVWCGGLRQDLSALPHLGSGVGGIWDRVCGGLRMVLHGAPSCHTTL